MKVGVGQKMLPISATDAAYLAGIIDGEGCVTISRKRSLDGTRGEFAYRPVVSVTNTGKGLLDWIVATTGLGKTAASKLASPRHKQAYRWQIWSRQVEQFLAEIKGFLVLKRPQADIVLEFMARSGNSQLGRQGLLATEWAFQIGCYNRLRILNKRGR